MVHQRKQAVHVFGRMARVSHFDAIDSLLDERGDTLARSGVRRMGEDRETASATNQLNGVHDRESILADVRWTAIAEIALECVAKIDRPAFGDHCARDVRPTDGAAARLLEDRRKLDLHAKLVESQDNALGA